MQRRMQHQGRLFYRFTLDGFPLRTDAPEPSIALQSLFLGAYGGEPATYGTVQSSNLTNAKKCD